MNEFFDISIMNERSTIAINNKSIRRYKLFTSSIRIVSITIVKTMTVNSLNNLSNIASSGRNI